MTPKTSVPPSYSKRHYEDFANLLGYTDDKELIERVVLLFSHDNPKFDRVRFRTVLHQQTKVRQEREFLRDIRPEMEAGITSNNGEQYVGNEKI